MEFGEKCENMIEITHSEKFLTSRATKVITLTKIIDYRQHALVIVRIEVSAKCS